MKLSIIIPCYNEEGNIEKIYNKIKETLNDSDYEIIFINDGSTDKTLDKLNKLPIKYINFSKNFGKDAAIFAGLEYSTGKYTCIIDADLQQNPKYIKVMFDYLEKNENIDQVAMVMNNRNIESKKNSVLKKIFYKTINKLSDTKFVDGASDFRMFRMNVKEAILSLTEANRFSKGIFSWIGFNTEYLPYNVEKRYTGITKFNTRNNLKYALEGITSFSTKPLDIAINIGISISLLSFIYIIVTIIQTILFGKTTPGYASLLIMILLLGGLQLTFIGIIGKYLGKNYIESKRRPIYIKKSQKGFDEEIL